MAPQEYTVRPDELTVNPDDLSAPGEVTVRPEELSVPASELTAAPVAQASEPLPPFPPRPAAFQPPSGEIRIPRSAHGVTLPGSVRVTEMGATNPPILDLNLEHAATKMGRGVLGLAKAGFAPQPLDPTMAAASDLIEGLFSAATPLIGAAAVENPVGVAWSLVRAHVAAKVGTAAAEELGATPEGQRLTGNVAALLSGTKSANDFVNGSLVDAAEVVAKAAQAKGRALTLAAKLSGSGYGPGEVPGARGVPTFEEPMVERAAREEAAARAGAISQEAAQVVAEQPPPPPRGPVEPARDVATTPEAEAAQAARVAAQRASEERLTPEQQAVREQLTGVRAPAQELQPAAAEVTVAPEALTPDTTAEDLQAAREQVDTEPTDAQKEAGNYQKGHVKIHGLDITIENPVGSVRSGTSPSGEKWSVTMPADYGYIKRTEGKDGDQVDVYIGPNPSSRKVYVIDQVDPDTRKFDEHKAILGTDSEEQARDLYVRGFSDGRGEQRIGAVTRLGVYAFEDWAKNGDTSKPLGGVSAAVTPTPQPPAQPDTQPEATPAPAPTEVPESVQPETRPTRTLREGFQKGDRVKFYSHMAGNYITGKIAELTDTGNAVVAVGDGRYTRQQSELVPLDWDWAQPQVAAPSGVTVTHNADRNSVEVKFEKKPEPGVLNTLKGAGFRWAKTNKLWYAVQPKGIEPERAIRETRDLLGLEAPAAKPVAKPEVTTPTPEPAPTTPRVEEMTLMGIPVTLKQREHVGGITFEWWRNDDGRAVYRQLDDDTGNVIDLVKGQTGPISSRFHNAVIKARGYEQPEVTVPAEALTPAEETGQVPEEGVKSTHGEAPIAPGGNDRREPAEPTRTPADTLGGRSGEVLEGEHPGHRPGVQGTEQPSEAPETPVLAGGTGDVEGASGEPESLTPVSGGDNPAPVAVSPTGATHDPGSRPLDYALTPERIEAISTRGDFTRAKDNYAAIQLVKELQAEQRWPTPDEQEVLAKYVGWGAHGVRAYLQSYPEYGWSANEKALHKAIRALPEEEIRALEGSTTNAHFTFGLYGPIWAALEHAGFGGGRVLEPAIGVGHAIGLMPGEIRHSSTITGVELEPLTAAIAGFLYPSATVQATGYQDALIARNTIDVAISNVPFAKTGIGKFDPDVPPIAQKPIQNYFFAKALEHLRPGGLEVFITSRYTMDAPTHRAFREYLMSKADFLGAVRLPDEAFDKTAKTEVITDIVVLRKRAEGAEPGPYNDLFIQTDEPEELKPTVTPSTRGTKAEQEAARQQSRVFRSAWYTAHPDQILGTEGRSGKLYGRAGYNVTTEDASQLQAQIEAALRRILPAGTYQRATAATTTKTKGVVDRNTAKVGELRVGEDGKSINVVNSRGEIEDATPMKAGKPNAGAVARLVGMIGLRDTRRALIALMKSDATDKEIEKAQRAFRKQYDAFVKVNGPLNNRINKALFANDPDSSALLTLEVLDIKATITPDPKTGKKTLKVTQTVVDVADIFRVRVAKAPPRMTKAETPRDALLASLAQHSDLDWPFMAHIAGTPAKKLQAALVDEGLVYEQPDGSFVLAEEYLSGDVVTKLADAKAAGKRFAGNVKVLEALQPTPKTKDDIASKVVAIGLGSGWVDTDVFQDFAREQLGTESLFIHKSVTSTLVSWTVSGAEAESDRHPLAVKHSEDTRVYGFVDLLSDTLNLKAPTLGFRDRDGRFWKDDEATLAARANQELLRGEWNTYLFANEELQDQLLATFNQRFNRTVERTYDGSHLTFEGMSDAVTLHPHQRNVIWRTLATGNTLYAHEVGAGKTFEMIAAAMEMRRTGRASKPMIVVPTYLIGQWRQDVLKLYPEAKLLAFDQQDLAADRRKLAMSRIANGDWDIVLVPHSSFGLLSVHPKRVEAMFEQWIAELEAAITNASSMEVRDLQQERDRLRDKAAAKVAAFQKRQRDNGLTWEELNVDALFIDEAHAFKNLFFFTEMENVRGLGRSEADRALDLYVKVQEINETSKYRNLVLATATPMMNTMAEVFTMQRYLQPQVLDHNGVSQFDLWYSMFAVAQPSTEQQPDGTFKEVMRLKEFTNLQLLSKMVRQVMDYVGWEDMPYLKLPKHTIEVVQTQPHPLYEKARTWFSERMERLGRLKPHIDKRAQEYVAPMRLDPFTGAPMGRPDLMLTIMEDAKKAATDLRMVFGNRAKDWPGSRVQAVAANVAKIYKATHKEKGAQLIFLDRGIPKELPPLEFLSDVTRGEDEGELADEEESIDDEVAESIGGTTDEDTPGGFVLYEALKRELERRGIPSKEIAFIHQARDAAERQALFQAVREGKIRVLFGSTDKGGVGMNVQKRLIAMHEVDAPRMGRPGDLQQRLGRIVRQGNDYDHVTVYRYVTQGTTDQWIWDLMNVKHKQVREFMRGRATHLLEEDPNTVSLRDAQLRSSGNPLWTELIDLRAKNARMAAAAMNAERAQASARTDVARQSERIRHLTRDIDDLKEWVDTEKVSLRGDAFKVTINRETYTKRADAHEALIKLARKAIEAKRDTGRYPDTVGQVGGITIKMSSESVIRKKDVVQEVTFRLDTSRLIALDVLVGAVEAKDGDDLSKLGEGQDLAARLVGAYETIPSYQRQWESERTDAERKKTASEATLAKGAPAVEDYRKAADRMRELEVLLKDEGEKEEERKDEEGNVIVKPPVLEYRAPLKSSARVRAVSPPTTLQMAVVPGAAEFGEHVLEPAAAAVANAWRHESKLVLSYLSPARIGVAPVPADTIRAHTAAHDQRVARAQKLLDDAFRVMGRWGREEVMAFWDVMEGLEDPDTLSRPARQFAELFKTIIDRWTQALVDADLLESYLEHYFPHEWKHGTIEGNALRRLFGRRPIQGPESYRKKRTIPTMREGLQMGLEPVSWNPAEQLQRKIVEMSRSLNARAMRDDLKAQGFYVFVPATKRPPEAIQGWQRVPEAALGTVYGPRVPEQTFGRVVAGHYYAPPEVVRLIENYISPGLYGRSMIFDAYKALSNAATSLVLGWTTFHLWLIGIESAISKQSVAIEAATRGNFKLATKFQAQVGPQGVLMDLVRGYKAIKEFYSRDADANDITGIIGQIIQGGGGFGWSQLEHENAPRKFGADVRALLGAVHRLEATTAAKATAKGALHGAQAAFELPLAGIMNHWVPYLKVSAFLDLAELELASLPDTATLADKRKVLGKAWDAVDDRFGQLRYANLFWNNTFKQILTGAFLSVGWQVGSLRHGLGAIGQIPRAGRALKRALEGGGGAGQPPAGPGGTPAAPGTPEPLVQREFAWLVTLLVFVMIISALYQYLHTGLAPGQKDKDDKERDTDLGLRDLFYPRNGKVDVNGREERDALISYAKDYYGWTHHPVTTLEHKLKPLLHTLSELVNNEDFFGNAIIDENDPAMVKARDIFMHLAKGVEPISFENAERRAGESASTLTLLKKWAEVQAIPFTPASAEMERSTAEQYLHDLIPPSHRTKEQAAQGAARRAMREQLKAGDVQAARQTAAEAGLSKRSEQAVARSLRRGPLLSAFQTTTWPQAVHTMELATPEERTVLRASFIAKSARAIQQERNPQRRAEIMADRVRILQLDTPKQGRTTES